MNASEERIERICRTGFERTFSRCAESCTGMPGGRVTLSPRMRRRWRSTRPRRLDYEVLKVRLNIAIAETECGLLDSARDKLETLLASLEAGRHERLRALAMNQLAVIHYRSKRLDAAEGFALKSNAIARPLEHHLVVFRNCFYLWQIAKARGDAGAVRLNERTLKTYVARIEETLPEIDEFRRLTAGDPS